jgi:acetyl/propionyl-CoA carboxylase alpha subunit/acetyl-CoA carboxylase carboxyltransferase component
LAPDTKQDGKIRAMTFDRLLIANRGEIAVRILRTARQLGIETVAVYSEDDADSLHVRRADRAVALDGVGPAAYLDGTQLVAAAVEAGCQAVHPGYGFLSENSHFGQRCIDAGLAFVGPRPELLELFGDKTAARRLAVEQGVAVVPGTNGATTLEEARAFFDSFGGPVMIKAVGGGGGRGMRPVRTAAEFDDAFARCQSEAQHAFGIGDVYVERLIERPRHIEVQILGDGADVTHLGERDCSIQRRHQKLVELAPSPWLDAGVRGHLVASAVTMASAARYDNAGTFEFLVDGEDIAFIETNARLQVEHTVTEETWGVDLVAAQLRIAQGEKLADLHLPQTPRLAVAVQARVNMETMEPDGTVLPAGGTLNTFDLPAGPGVRVDTFGYTGYRTSASFDSLLAKVIVSAETVEAALRLAASAVDELRVEGVRTNASFLRTVLRHPDVIAGRADTRFIDDHLAELVPATDPLVISGDASAITAPMLGTVVSIDVEKGEAVHAGQQLLVLEAMKMEHLVVAKTSGIVRDIAVAAGDTVDEGQMLVVVDEADVDVAATDIDEVVDLDKVRPDLADVHDRHALGYDAARPDAVERRRRTGQRTTRENVGELVDPGSFVEYGPLVIAAQRRRRPVQELIERTPADGLVGGVGRVNGGQCVVMSYDYTVLAGTQGLQNHRKKDRLFELAEKHKLPVVFFTEGGGGRPGDTDGMGVAGLDCMAFHLFGRLSGLVPLVGINSGRCFAGNAAILGCCDVVIATDNSNIGMGGPAMIEGGGLGVFRPEDVGPMDVQVPNGVVDIAVADEAEAVQAAKQYLSYFQGPSTEWECDDQRRLRVAIPENRLRVYDVRSVIETMADTGSVLELRRHFGRGMVTALVRVEGQPMGLVANNPTHLAGAIDAEGADKAARFMQLCDAFDLPLLFLCDTPGIMVGPEVERTALVRHCSRMFVTGANLTVPFFTIILRKAYGLGAQAMAGGSFKAPFFTVSWPTGEFGGMGLEGAVKLGYRNELDAIEDPNERKTVFDEMVDRMYQHGKALNTATHFEIDDVIDPVDSRRWILSALDSTPPPLPRAGKKRPNIDTW